MLFSLLFRKRRSEGAATQAQPSEDDSELSMEARMRAVEIEVGELWTTFRRWQARQAARSKRDLLDLTTPESEESGASAAPPATSSLSGSAEWRAARKAELRRRSLGDPNGRIA